MKTPFLSPIKKLSLAVFAISLFAVYSAQAVMVMWVGTNGVSATTNWSDIRNWVLASSISTQMTPVNNAGNFTGITAVNSLGPITVNVDGAYNTPGTGTPQVYGAFFGQTNGYHTVFIQPGFTLDVQAGAGTPGLGIAVGPQVTNNNSITAFNTPSVTYTNYTTIEGIGGTLFANTGGLRVEAPCSVVNNHYSILDMSGLGTFVMTNTSAATADLFYVCAGGLANSQGLAYLALTNVITLYSAFEVGYLASSSNSLPIGVYLGQSNYITTGAGNNYMVIGYTGCTNAFMKFNPNVLGGASKPTAYITGTSAGQNVWICNASGGKVPGYANVDLTGGNVTWIGATMTLGIAGTASPNTAANGVLTFDNGTVTFPTIVVGDQSTSAGAIGVGTINIGTNAILQASTKITLGATTGTVTAGTTGTININTNGTLQANIVTNGGAGSTINMTNANWLVSLTSTSLTNITVANFNAGGTTNIINITSITPFLNGSLPLRFHLIATASSPNLVGASTLGVVLPTSYNPTYPYMGYLDYTTTPGLVDFVLTAAPPTARVLTWSGTNAGGGTNVLGGPDGDWDVATTADWVTNAVGTIYNQYDLATFNDVPGTAQTNVNLTTTITPYSLTVSNNSSLYTFSGSGSLSGGTGLTKQGTGTLILDNGAANNFTGGVTISGGVLQVGANDTGGSLPGGSIVNNSVLAVDQTGTLAISANISGTGTVVSEGGGTLQLAAANTFTNNVIATNNSTLQGGVAGAFGATNGAVIIASGSTLDPNGAGTTRAVTVSGTGVGGNGAIVNSGGTIGDSSGGLTPTLTLTGDTTLSYPARWDLGSSTGATLNSGGHNLTLNGTGNNTYFEWRDVRADTNLANIFIVAGYLGIAGSTTVGNPGSSLVIYDGAGLKFYNDDGFNAAINKQVVLNDGGLIQNGSGASVIDGGLNIVNSNGSQYCSFTIGGTSLTVNGTVTGNGILYLTASTSPLIINGDASAFTGGVVAYSGTFTLNSVLGSGIGTQMAATLSGTGTANGLVDDRGPFQPGGINTIGTFTAAAGLTLESSATLTMDLTPNTGVGGVNNDLVAVTGSLILNSPALVINPIGGLTSGTYTLITYTGSASGSFASVIASSRYTLTLTNNTSAQAIQLIVSGSGSPANLVWENYSGNGAWDLQSSQNWSNTTTMLPDVFYASDSVTFDDSIITAANPTGNINVTQLVSPTVVTVSSSATNYTFSGPGQIGGAASLVKTGASTLAINTTNTFTGPVTISGGTVQAGNVSALGAATGTVTITNGGTLDLEGYYITAKSYAVSGPGVGGNGAIINSGAAVFDNPGSLTNITLHGDATFGGPTRWDFGNRTSTATLSTGGNAYNLTLTNASANTYTWEWYNVAADASLSNINIGAGELGVAGTTSLGSASGTVTIYPNAQIVFYGGSNLAKIYHVLNGGTIQINQGGPTFNFAQVNMENGATFSSAATAQITGPASLLGLANFDITAATTFSNAISGVGGIILTNSNSNPLILAGTNTYGGATVLTSGKLELLGNGSISDSTNIYLTSGTTLTASTRSDATLTLASGQTLDGSGTVAGNLTASPGSIVAPGFDGTGTLTVTNIATLQGVTSMGVGAGSNNLLNAGSIGYGGTLQVSFVPGSLADGNSFKLFNASSYSGNFTSITPQPATNLQWTTQLLDTSGTISVSAIHRATFSPSIVSGPNLTLNGTGGTTNGTYRLLTTTNISVPVTNWVQIGTGVFDGSGNFSIGVVNTNNAAQFYTLGEP